MGHAAVQQKLKEHCKTTVIIKKKNLKKMFFLNDTNEPVYTTGNSIQSLGKELDGRYYKKGNVCICMTGALYCTAEIGQIL